VNGVERSSVRGRKPEFEQLALLIETAAVETAASPQPTAASAVGREIGGNDAGCAEHLTAELHVETTSGHTLRIQVNTV
jgi:hypothetical protein